MNSKNTIFGQLGYQAGVRRGEETEKQVMKAFEESKIGTPSWFIRLDRSTYEQDWENGIDFVVQSDIGNLFLQIKSSEYWVGRFLSKQKRRKYNQYIAVTFITSEMTSEEVCSRIVRVLSKKRNKLLAIRNGFTVARPSVSAH